MSDGISDMHMEEERKAAVLVEKCCANCINSESSCDSGICSLCSGHLEFCPSLKAIAAKVEELRKEQIIVGSKENLMDVAISFFKKISELPVIMIPTFSDRMERMEETRQKCEELSGYLAKVKSERSETLEVLNRLVKWNGIYNDKPFPELKSDFDIICEDAAKLIEKAEGK